MINLKASDKTKTKWEDMNKARKERTIKLYPLSKSILLIRVSLKRVDRWMMGYCDISTTYGIDPG